MALPASLLLFDGCSRRHSRSAHARAERRGELKRTASARLPSARGLHKCRMTSTWVSQRTRRSIFVTVRRALLAPGKGRGGYAADGAAAVSSAAARGYRADGIAGLCPHAALFPTPRHLRDLGSSRSVARCDHRADTPAFLRRRVRATACGTTDRWPAFAWPEVSWPRSAEPRDSPAARLVASSAPRSESPAFRDRGSPGRNRQRRACRQPRVCRRVDRDGLTDPTAVDLSPHLKAGGS
jgi:hypothetical protein